MKNLRIRGKLAGSFAIILAILVGIGGLSIYNQSSLNSSAERISRVDVLRLNELSTVVGGLGLYRATESAHILAALPDEITGQDQKLRQLRHGVVASIDTLEQNDAEAAGRADLAKLRGELKSYFAKSDKLLDYSRRNLDQDATDYYQDSQPEFDVLLAHAEKLAKANTALINSEVAASSLVYKVGRTVTVMGVGVAFASIAVLLMLLLRAIAKPLGEMTSVMAELGSGNTNVALPVIDSRDEVADLVRATARFRDQLAEAEQSKAAQAEMLVSSVGDGLARLAKGDLLSTIDVALNGPFEKLRTDFNNTVRSLNETLGEVAHASGGISHGAGEIRQASDDLSHRTERQASSLQDTAAAIDAITGTVKQAAADSTRANTAVDAARTEAEHGGEVVRKAVGAMGSIERASSEISEIISVIDGIAFQTNLLALNAGVEAARAGDAGKGFAVVASEVRALAQRSAEAAKDVKARINASSEHVRVGVQLVGETGQALEHIIGSIGEISSLVSSITTSANQQASGLAQVNSAVAELDGFTQQNAAMVEETTAAARSLASEAEGLARHVSRFKTTEQLSVAKPVPMTPAPKPGMTRPVPASAPQPRFAGNAALAVEEDWAEF